MKRSAIVGAVVALLLVLAGITCGACAPGLPPAANVARVTGPLRPIAVAVAVAIAAAVRFTVRGGR